MKGKIKIRQVHGRKYLLLVTLLDSYNSQNEQEESVDMFTFDEILEFIKASNDSKSCDWVLDKSEDSWHTVCGEIHRSPTGKYKFCPYCGNNIRLA